MNYRTTPCLALTACLVQYLVGCAEEQAEHTVEPAKLELDQTKQVQAPAVIPDWQPHIEPYGLVSQAAKEWFVANRRDNERENYYDILGGDCSWYCAGWPKSVIASSTLPDEGPYAYTADLAHDLRYDTAWVEGVEGPGIGESLTYTFENKHPRVTKILIHTGYIKDETTWIKNNRVRTLELSINGEPEALLQLSDTRAEQSFNLKEFSLGPLGRSDDGKDLVLTFTIRDIYPGTKYDDTAITEIYFDGIDDH